MIVNFPHDKTDELSPKEAFVVYKHLIDDHLRLLNLASKCEFFYWKTTGAFYLCIFASIILHNKGIISNTLPMILFMGMGCLVIFAQNAKIDFEHGINSASCVQRGIILEKKHDYPDRLFMIYEDNKTSIYRANLLSRLAPIGFVGLATSIAVTLLALKGGTWLAVIAAFLSICVLFMIARFYAKITRKIILRE